MQDEILIFDVWVLVDMVYALGVERRGSAFDAVYFVAFLKEKLREVRTVLTGYAGYKGFFH